MMKVNNQKSLTFLFHNLIISLTLLTGTLGNFSARRSNLKLEEDNIIKDNDLQYNEGTQSSKNFVTCWKRERVINHSVVMRWNMTHHRFICKKLLMFCNVNTSDNR